MNRLFLMLLSLLSLTACSKYKIEGSSSVASLDGKMLFLKIWEHDDMVNVDSCEIVHGKFSMQGKVDSVMMVTLYMDDQPLIPMVLEKGNIKVSIDDLELTASGTPLNNKLKDFIEQQSSLNARADELSHKETQMIMDGKDPLEIQNTLQTEGEKLNDEMEKLVMNFITENYDNVLGTGLFMILCSNMQYPMMTPQIEEILAKAPDNFKNNVFVKEFVEAAQENQRRMDYR